MKKALVLLVVTVLVLSAIQEVGSPNWTPTQMDENLLSPVVNSSAASVSGGGSSQTATMFFDRTITGENLNIFNTYSDTATHNAILDLSTYQVAGWRLSNAKIDTENISAAAEKEVVGQTYENLNFQVADILGTFHSQTAQGFYNYSHNGVLVNYSIYYVTDRYSPALRGNASLVVRSGNQIETASDITTPENMTASEGVLTWVTVSGENATLSANTLHWAVVDGSLLHEGGAPFVYPTIFWTGEDSAGTYPSKYRGTSSWITQTLEALLNYTYIPWNQTANAPLEYSSPQQVDLKGNSSTITSSSFSFSSATKNITSISFDTNQSVYFNYNMTLSYVKDASAAVSWEIASSGGLVDWSVVIGTAYPSVTGQVSKYLNISKAGSWTITGLYESAAPTTNHTDYVLQGTTVRCASMTDGTWRLAANSYNHLSELKTYDSSDDTELVSLSSILVNVDVNLTILEQDSDSVSTGLANLTIVKSGSVVWSPTNKSVSSGEANYLWNIDSTTSDNGVFTLEVSWANGTDAGYMTKEITIYYPTLFTTSTPSINAYTESTFDVSVYFGDTFTPQGLDGTDAAVVYSFDGGSNTSLFDHNNGTWTASISTTGKAPGSYLVDIFAEGYALQNRSLQATVNLIHDTEALTILWSNTNNITYIESTELSVAYNRVGGSPITDATVNVTFDTTTWLCVWDGPSQTYKVTFDGSDVPPGYGVHSLTIEAWKDGHKAQLDSTQIITLQEEPTTLDIQWSNGFDITYIESTTLIANYTMSDGSPVLTATVNVTIGSDTLIMSWVGATQTYQYVFDGDAVWPGFGIHGVTVEAGKFGYVYKSNSSLSLTIDEEPTTIFVTWDPDFDISYIEETYLIVHYNMSDGSPITGATVNVTINSYVFNLTWHAPSQTYRLLINGSDDPPGLGMYTLLVQADLYGFESRSDNARTLILQEDQTTLILSWSDGSSISYIGQTTLSASYTMSNGSAIRGALVNVTIGLDTWLLDWHEGSDTYRVTFFGTDVTPGFGTHNLTIKADLFGFVGKTDSTEQLIISEESTTLFRTWSNDFDISYIEETYLIVHYNMSDGTPIVGATVNVTINSYVFNLTWHTASQTYRLLINGSDDPPGLGTFSISIRADLFGYEAKAESGGTLVLQEDQTTLILSWSDGNNITYIGQTTLTASYTMSNGSAIRGALVNVTIGLDTWLFDWHEGSDTYRVTLLGTDDPPGFDTHSLTVKADLFGFVGRTDSTEQLTITEDPTTMTISWSNGFGITYVTQTTLSVSYRMSNTTPIEGATVTATIGVDVWDLTWNESSKVYEVTFRGDDDPPGLGVHPLTIDASKTGFVSRSDDTETLTIDIESTSMELEWWLSDTISYVGQTVLYANFTMSNGSAVVGAFVTVAIGTTNKTFEWNAISEVYHVILSGSDPGYSLGAHSVTVQATLFGYEPKTDSTQTLTVLEESTTVTPSWNPDNNITDFETTTLSVRYDMSNGTAIPGAIVNITIGTDVWILVWDADSKAYEYTFTGTDNPPGHGTHSIEVRTSKYGYESIIDSTQQITLRLEDTIISFEWDPSDTITYVEETKIRIFYQMTNGTPVLGATVNITRGPMTWDAVWNGTSQAYEYSWLGSDDPPGLASHLLLIKAWKANYVGIVDISQTLTLNEEPTLIFVSWSNSNNITYVQSTTLRVNYTTSSGVAILGALVDVTIGTDNWILSWNATSKFYEKTFSGADSPPGLETHSLSIRGWQFGYETTIDATETLTLREEPTTLTPSWSPGNTITYVGSTTLSVRYETSNEDPISGANVNVTIGTDVWILSWNPVSEVYEYTFSGSEDPPGLGTHSLTIQASNWGYQYASNSLESLTINEDPTSLVISWSNTDNITFVFETTLSVRYLMGDTNNITGAILNVTINGNLWSLDWNESSNAYEVTIRGDDDPPGYGTHSVEIRASKFGFVSIVDTTQEFTIRLEDTSVSFVWVSSSTITYTEQAKIRISYVMSNETPIVGATVNVTIGIDTWTAIWNDTDNVYEYTWFGTDDPPGLGTHLLLVQAWKINYAAILNTSQVLTIHEEPTVIQAYWTAGNAITFVQSTTLQVNYTASDGSTILGASVDVTIWTDNWVLVWNASSQLYEITFSGSDDPPGLGTHGLSIRGIQFGYETTVDSTTTLVISGELGSISSELLEGSTISFIGYTTLAVNYTMSNGTAIPLATVNVTIGGTLWNLTWHPTSETYRIQFNGTDSPPGFGTHNLIVSAWRAGFDGVSDSTQFLTIEEEVTSLDIYWGAPNFNNVTYFDYTYLFAEYKMNNGTVIQGANVNVTIASTTWTLEWNATQVAYSLRFNGSDTPPGLGTHDLVFEADKFGFEHRVVSDITLILSKDPTTLGVFWVGGNDITYVEYTTLSVTYKMSNGSDIQGATVNATIGGTTWVLSWNVSAGAYQVQFTGDQDPPGLDSFTVLIQASAEVFAAQSDSTSLIIQAESTTATQSWSLYSIDWTESVIFSVDFKDSYGNLIEDSTTKSVYINGTEYLLLGTNGTYWIEFNNTFDLGLHNVWANFSKFGYDSATVLSITFTISKAPTALTIIWSSPVIDYLGQADLTVDYYYVGSGISVPPTGVLANITIDGAVTIPLTLQGNLWVANLTGISLDLGAHNIEIHAWVYGYEYSETLEVVTVNEVSTDPLSITWSPSNLTIEYTDLLNLTVDYTYYGGDVPGSAIVNVSIEGRLYPLVYSGGLWRVSIPGDDLGIGLRTATISAWLYGYALQTDVTANINVTEAANTFDVTWEPLSLDASYIDLVNASVTYTQDYLPIVGATVQLTINGTPYILAYNAADEVWYFSMRASDIGLGIWNITVTANKTGYADGWDSVIVSISPAATNLTVIQSAASIYFDEEVTIDIYYQLLNTSYVPGATLTLEVDGIAQITTWNTDHWTYTRSGSVLGLGVYSIYIHVVAFGFEVVTNTSSIEVVAIPTNVTTPIPTVSIYAFETATISFTWTDVKNSVNISGFIPSVIWPDTFSVIDHGNGMYSVEINSDALHVGSYELHVNFTRTGYENSSQLVAIEILELPLAPIFDNEIEQFENETISIVIQVFDGPHAAIVDWAEIIIELEGVQYTLVYDAGSEDYSIEIWLSALAPGSYTLNFTISAVDCETEYGEIQLEIEQKDTYYLVLDVDEEVQAGQPIDITVSATYESGAANGLPITVHIMVERGENAPQERTEDVLTNAEGIALLVFNVPSDATGLTIWAEFEPAIGEWPATSNTINREVTPGGFDILSFIFSLFEDPLTLIIIVGGVGGSVAGLILLKRRRGGPKVTKPVATNTVAPPSVTPTAPVGEMDLLQDEIKQYPTGLTRTQIAKSLDISKSKASVLVKKLLESDTGFEEVIEGRLRRIRFRGEE
ncbi:MAG: hypothetical protein ACW97G_04295 [Candidatus Thorarchaeota archaeon]|jgi:hypothetical protein